MAQPGQQLPKAEGWDLGASPWEGGRAGPGSPGPSHLQPGAASGTGTALGIGYLPGDGDGLRSRLSRARGWAGQGCGELETSPAVGADASGGLTWRPGLQAMGGAPAGY